MAGSNQASPTKHVAAMPRGANQVKITSPWFVDRSEYKPAMGSFKILVNGEEAFGDVYRAIEAAKKSVCIICWAFQPSMYFIRDGKHLMIGALLEKKAREGVLVRVLCWAFKAGFFGSPSFNVTGYAVDESNTPGRWPGYGIKDRPPTSSDTQYKYDIYWFQVYDRQQATVGAELARIVLTRNLPKDKLLFYSRGFSAADRASIATTKYEDRGLSALTKAALELAPTHHQKMVLVDYEDPASAVGFVMGHNSLDHYWDTSDHSAIRKAADLGNNAGPLHDYSSRVTGPILSDLFDNFASAWKGETGEKLPPAPFSTFPIRDEGVATMCQIVRTRAHPEVQNIKACYLKAPANATQYIHIENQYFRWPPLAELIKKNAAKFAADGRIPEVHGYLYLFVITNTSDAGMGSGTINTYRMLECLGRADALPEVTRDQRLEKLDAELATNRNLQQYHRNARINLDQSAGGLRTVDPALPDRLYASIDEKLRSLEAQRKQLEAEKSKLAPLSSQEKASGSSRVPEEIKQAQVPGLKVHIATLVAPDTPPGKAWEEVYIHAKLMLIDDAFMTVGSANINTRSMEVDSELNIIHERPQITSELRTRQWAKYTSGRVSADMPLQGAYKKWMELMLRNTNAKKLMQPPVAQLAEFLRVSAKISNTD